MWAIRLCDLVADHPCLAASLGIDLLQEYTKGGRRFQIRLSADPEDVYTVEILDFVPKPEVNDDYRNPNRRGPRAPTSAPLAATIETLRQLSGDPSIWDSLPSSDGPAPYLPWHTVTRILDAGAPGWGMRDGRDPRNP